MTSGTQSVTSIPTLRQVIQLAETEGVKIGEGTYGVVYKVREFILKRLKDCSDAERKDELLKEFTILHYLNDNCPGSFPQAYEYGAFNINGEQQCFILMERIEGMDGQALAKLLYNKKESIPYNVMTNMTLQLLRGLTCMHRLNYYHHDIKPANIMISNTSGRVVFVDLGLVCRTNIDKECMALTSMDPPEVFLQRSRFKYWGYELKRDSSGRIIGEEYKPVRDGTNVPVKETTQEFWNKIDVYDLGITFKMIMYPEISHDEKIYEDMEHYPPQNKQKYGDLDYLVNAMVAYDPRDRPDSFTALEVLEGMVPT